MEKVQKKRFIKKIKKIQKEKNEITSINNQFNYDYFSKRQG